MDQTLALIVAAVQVAVAAVVAVDVSDVAADLVANSQDPSGVCALLPVSPSSFRSVSDASALVAAGLVTVPVVVNTVASSPLAAAE